VTIPAEAAAAPIRLDPGHHVITAGENGVARAAVDLAERDVKTISLTLPAEAPASASATAAPVGPESPATAHESPHTARTIAIAGFGVGAAGLAAGAITGLMSIQKTNQLKSTCGPSNTCAPSNASDLDAARTTATVSTIAFVVAGAGVAVGVGALLIGDRHSPDASAPQTGVRVTPWIGLGAAGVRGSF
jgi:hypothetical protein